MKCVKKIVIFVGGAFSLDMSIIEIRAFAVDLKWKIGKKVVLKREM